MLTDQEMDGEATLAAFATCPGPDCLKDVIPKYGTRVKVCNTLKAAINEEQKASILEFWGAFVAFSKRGHF